MDRNNRPANIVGNEFFVPEPRAVRPTPAPVRRGMPAAALAHTTYERPAVVQSDPQSAPQPAAPTISIPIEQTYTPPVSLPITPSAAPAMVLRPALPTLRVPKHITLPRSGQRALNVFHDHSVIAFSLLVLLVSSTGIMVYGNYQTAAIESNYKPSGVSSIKKTNALVGPAKVVPSSQVEAEVSAIAAQSATLTIGDQSRTIRPETIRSWLQLVPSKNGKATGIHVNGDAMTKTVTDLANTYEKAPISQITSTVTGSPQVIATGRNGYHLTNPETIKQQTPAIAASLFAAKGVAYNTPLATVPFQAATPADFAKMIEINVSSKQMYLYDNGQVTHSYPISAGAPSTPTPIGQYHIFSKYAVQDMKGTNPNGTPYSQPHVRWINYFLPGGYAIHGNYWRPASWFGNINSSHGCASLPDTQAKEVYDWAPMGTTVVTHE